MSLEPISLLAKTKGLLSYNDVEQSAMQREKTRQKERREKKGKIFSVFPSTRNIKTSFFCGVIHCYRNSVRVIMEMTAELQLEVISVQGGGEVFSTFFPRTEVVA